MAFKTVKKLFIRPYQGRLPLKDEVEIGWNFTDETGTVDLVFGQVGIGAGADDQNDRLENIVAELREDQKRRGLIHDFEIDDRRPSGNP